MKTAVIQLNSGDDKEKNIGRAAYLVEKALKQKAKFVALPEIFHFRGGIKDANELRNIKESISGPAVSAMKALAEKHKAFILAGSIYENVKGQAKAFNTSVLIDEHGKIAAKYRKNHLFKANVGNASVCESKRFLAGKKIAIANIGNFKAGLSICYDVRFPGLYSEYLRKGVHILCVPSAFTKKTGNDHWEVLLRARAIENMCYVVAPNQCGEDNQGMVHYGHSMIIDPWGKILARASGDKEEIVYASLDKRVFKQYSKVLPSIRKG